VTADVSRWAREIVAKRALIVGVVTVALGAAVSYGWLNAAQEANAAKAVDLALTVLGLLVAAFWARQGVTPADPDLVPKSADGQLLVPESHGPLAGAKASPTEKSLADRPPLGPGATVHRKVADDPQHESWPQP